MKTVFIVYVILSLQHLCTSKMNICLNNNKFCHPTQICVTWERACSIGANCVDPTVKLQPRFECISTSVNRPIIPLKELCGGNEIWARGVQKLCRNHPCPLWWGYTCYARSYKAESCDTARRMYCQDLGKVCVIEEKCNEHYCEPKPMCLYY